MAGEVRREGPAKVPEEWFLNPARPHASTMAGEGRLSLSNLQVRLLWAPLPNLQLLLENRGSALAPCVASEAVAPRLPWRLSPQEPVAPPDLTETIESEDEQEAAAGATGLWRALEGSALD